MTSTAKSDLAERKCVPCEGGVQPLGKAAAEKLRVELVAGWTLASDAQSIQRRFKFRDFFHTMSFVNAVAHIANLEDHHPDLAVSYGQCDVTFTTHAIKGLSENDFICAAKIDRIPLD